MARNATMITKVFKLPADSEKRLAFLEGVKALAEQCGVEETAGSSCDEMTYVERLEKELLEHISDSGIEDIRQEYESEVMGLTG